MSGPWLSWLWCPCFHADKYITKIRQIQMFFKDMFQMWCFYKIFNFFKIRILFSIEFTFPRRCSMDELPFPVSLPWQSALLLKEVTGTRSERVLWKLVSWPSVSLSWPLGCSRPNHPRTSASSSCWLHYFPSVLGFLEFSFSNYRKRGTDRRTDRQCANRNASAIGRLHTSSRTVALSEVINCLRDR